MRKIIILLIVLSFGIFINATGQPAKSDSVKLKKPEMVLVEGGTYTMGLIKEEASRGFGSTTRTHEVTLSSFSIGKYEITQAEWQAVMGDSLNFSLHAGCTNCPVEEVSWNDVQLFIRILNRRTGKHYQLPTEAQWEFAARGGKKSKGYKYAGSDNIDDVALMGGAFTSQTQPVGKKRPNELGIYDMPGNVSEWCQDWFNTDYRTLPEIDPRVPLLAMGILFEVEVGALIPKNVRLQMTVEWVIRMIAVLKLDSGLY